MPPRYPTDALLDAALELYVEGGLEAVTMSGVARVVGAPSGSLYHRFSGRGELLARLWLRTSARFQEGYLEELGADGDPLAAARRAVQHLLGWVRTHPGEALLLARHSADDLVHRDEVGEDIREQHQRMDERVRRAMTVWSGRHGQLSSARTRLALVDLPLAAVRPYLRSGEAVPDEVDAMIQDALGVLLPA